MCFSQWAHSFVEKNVCTRSVRLLSPKHFFCCFTLEMKIERSFVSGLPSVKSLSKIQIQIFSLIRRFVSDLAPVVSKNGLR